MYIKANRQVGNGPEHGFGGIIPTTVREGVLLSVRSTFGEEPYFHVNLKSFLPTVSTWSGSLDTARGQ